MLVMFHTNSKRGVALADQDRDSPSESEAKRGWGASVHFGWVPQTGSMALVWRGQSKKSDN